MFIALNRLIRNLKRCRSGAVAVEFAMVAPIFFAMLYGLFEAGRYYWYKNSLDFAVEEATRYAGVSSTITAGDIATYVENSLQFDAANVDINVNETTDAATGLTFREVTASIPFSLYAWDTQEFLDISVSARSKYLVVE